VPTTYRGTRSMAADADIVLNTAADPARVQAWLPDVASTVEVLPEKRTVVWRSEGRVAVLRVVDRGAGACEAHLLVEGAAEPAGFDRALNGLAAEVEENFSAG